MSDNAAAIWRRLLGVLGDVNEIDDPDIHEAVFHSLIDIWKTLFKVSFFHVFSVVICAYLEYALVRTR